MSGTRDADPVYPGLTSSSAPVAPEELDRFRRSFERAVRHPNRVRFLHPDGKARRRLPLPWRVRVRLRLNSAVDGVCSFLCGCKCTGAALLLWRAAGMRHTGR